VTDPLDLLTRLSPEEQLAELRRGVVDLHVERELLEALRRAVASRNPLKIKAGFDPTRPDLHLGHVVLMNKMRAFQELGHEVVFVVGDFTAQIGDPSGRSATRKVPTREEILEGARTYAEQAFKILDPARTRVVHNSEWLGQMRFDDVIRLAGRYTLARMMERDDFKKRWADHASISLHELLYPLAQAQDSVVLDADVELGGTDQLFNLLVGRHVMAELGMRPQCVMTTPILEGINARVEGGRIVGDKMSKSLDNYVGVAEPPAVQMGKLMSIADGLMWRYYELLSAESVASIAARKAACEAGTASPRDAKLDLAEELVRRFHGAEAARAAREGWLAQFSRKEIPADLPTVQLRVAAGAAGVPLVEALAAGFGVSKSEARRKLAEGAVERAVLPAGDREILPKGTDGATALLPGRYALRVGKRWVAVAIAAPDA
jgi:tyrosyl-tRNA synthetase